jgi:hypothetical protein
MYYTMFRTCPLGALDSGACLRVSGLGFSKQDCTEISQQICSEVKASPELMSLPSGDVHWKGNQTFTDAKRTGRYAPS